MRLRDKIVRLLLIAMILLSLFLSLRIWTQSTDKQVRTTDTEAADRLQARSAERVFVPSNLVYHPESGENLYTNRESLIQGVLAESLSFNLSNLNELPLSTRQAYIDYLKQTETVELIFPNALPLGYYLEINGCGIRDELDDHAMVSRILINYKRKKLSFLDDKQKKIYAADFQGNTTALENLVKEKDNRYIAAELEEETDPIFYSYLGEVKLKKYSYILEIQSYTMFSKMFFSSTEDIFSSDNANKDVRLLTNSGQKLTVSYATGEILFTDPQILSQDPTVEKNNNLHEKTFGYIEKMGKTADGVRYFDQAGTKITYRRYVEGYPIFSDYYRGRIEITANPSGIKLLTNQNIVQVPIPSDEEVPLPPTKEILQQLLDAGMKNEEMQNIQVGYSWKTNPDNKQIVDLEPEWYVKYHDEWHKVSDTLQLLEKQGGEL
ncbi:YycH family regulatory protein [Vagococcus elongatus]|uniref:Regulatory protein YycH domain-containing protein n=1 Tax=Vagococcus elongatus TaxID=180344 RepID=A0A430B4P2_9ENTE|nr:two-component system activity regulator YycH [Vagococcus elongatus]RSU15273.1 hypothetical protein CBF29_02770 [Vagococcus elongatus]